MQTKIIYVLQLLIKKKNQNKTQQKHQPLNYWKVRFHSL